MLIAAFWSISTRRSLGASFKCQSFSDANFYWYSTSLIEFEKFVEDNGSFFIKVLANVMYKRQNEKESNENNKTTARIS